MVKNKGEEECLSFFFLLRLTFYTAEDLEFLNRRESMVIKIKKEHCINRTVQKARRLNPLA